MRGSQPLWRKIGPAASILVLLVAGSGAASAHAAGPTSASQAPGPAWVNLTGGLTGGVNPGARDDGAMLWIPGTAHALLFGGLLDNPYAVAASDTWTFNGSTWQNHSQPLAPHPSARWGLQYEMTYDTADHYALLFGGEVGYIGTGNNETWAFYHHSWHNLTRAVGPAPSPRFAPDVVYDPADGYVVLFGGTPQWGASTCFNDTWIFSAGKWHQLTSAVAPSPRRGADMVYDPALRSVVLVGGSTANFTPLHDTWLFSAGKWTPLQTKPHPRAQWWGAMAYDPHYKAVVLFGGCTVRGCTTARASTWFLLANRTWVDASTAFGRSHHPSARSGTMAFYDPLAREIIVYGGSFPNGSSTDEVWALR
jgi:hypothetical protein